MEEDLREVVERQAGDLAFGLCESLQAEDCRSGAWLGHSQETKKVLKGGKRIWKPPIYVKLLKKALPGGKKAAVKVGTQVVDRAWRFVKDRLRVNHAKTGSVRLQAQIRSAQYEYWATKTCGQKLLD